ncbi:PLP-dependent lyase/thiolase [Allorhodopirellula solitaria]|uniref:Threonine synthase n=1 Tax=Allorhodopirellula solitaria TaxID=2527987 RepID=A0A5C5XR04_9BACT|nr:PLP-dependent lyase/thiolase [Allorhodopirellula solitaria]TWT65334.1 Threonine synthase [Allorhodopirellula solitaria]
MSVWNWSDRYSPTVDQDLQVTLGEGQTACVRSRRIGPALGIKNLYFKLESTNPSGSYKDRFAALAISHMLQREQNTCLATSSGNTGAALAAYCAAAGIRCQIAVVETAPLAKLQQMMAYGAEIQRVRGFGTDSAITNLVFDRLQQLAAQPQCELQISAYRYSPLGMQGVESIAFEIEAQISDLGRSVDHVFCPAGGGGLTLATARGFQKTSARPAVHCVQPEGNDTIASPLRNRCDQATDVQCTTSISGLQVASVIDGHDVIACCSKSKGTGYTVSDAETFEVQKRLAQEEGIFCEPAGAVAMAGALNAFRSGQLDPEATVVCIVSGSGFKDATSIQQMNQRSRCELVDVDDLFQPLTMRS